MRPGTLARIRVERQNLQINQSDLIEKRIMKYFTHTIHLSAPLQGEDIATIIQLACESSNTKFVRKTFYRDGHESYGLGQDGTTSQRFIVVPPEGRNLFESGISYKRIVVTEHPDATEAYDKQPNSDPLIYHGGIFVQAIEKARGRQS